MNSGMAVGDIGFEIILNPGGFALAGYTGTLIAIPGQYLDPLLPIPNTAQEFSPLSIVGANAVYSTNGSDFTSSGFWTLWLRVTRSGFQKTSPPVLFYVNPAPL